MGQIPLRAPLLEVCSWGRALYSCSTSVPAPCTVLYRLFCAAAARPQCRWLVCPGLVPIRVGPGLGQPGHVPIRIRVGPGLGQPGHVPIRIHVGPGLGQGSQ